MYLHIEPFKQFKGSRTFTYFIEPLLPEKRAEQPCLKHSLTHIEIRTHIHILNTHYHTHTHTQIHACTHTHTHTHILNIIPGTDIYTLIHILYTLSHTHTQVLYTYLLVSIHADNDMRIRCVSQGGIIVHSALLTPLLLPPCFRNIEWCLQCVLVSCPINGPTTYIYIYIYIYNIYVHIYMYIYAQCLN